MGFRLVPRRALRPPFGITRNFIAPISTIRDKRLGKRRECINTRTRYYRSSGWISYRIQSFRLTSPAVIENPSHSESLGINIGDETNFRYRFRACLADVSSNDRIESRYQKEP